MEQADLGWGDAAADQRIDLAPPQRLDQSERIAADRSTISVHVPALLERHHDEFPGDGEDR
jgi:hypothetical protein